MSLVVFWVVGILTQLLKSPQGQCGSEPARKRGVSDKQMSQAYLIREQARSHRNHSCSAKVQLNVNECHLGMSVIMLQLSLLSKSLWLANARSLFDH
ncbi:hypothetical protein, partial [Pseudomonas sp. R62]|uniref:hypothetical protein n=1 Tax=Pseudomonas sp. R62 TaxID=1144884 RepID=UPI001EE644F3